MKAVVLTYDKYHFIAHHMLNCYQELWPNHPFKFIIPYQNSSLLYFKQNGRQSVELMKTPADIKSTVLELINNLDDEEFVFWAMDDRYPIDLNVKEISSIKEWVLKSKEKVDGISFTLSSKDNSIKYSHIYTNRLHGPNNIKLFKKKHYGSIWSHQFLKVKVLRKFFTDMPDNIIKAKEMDHYLLNDSRLPKSFNLFVTSRSFGLYGESSSRGKLTENCQNSMKNKGIEIPAHFELTGEKIIFNVDDNKNRFFVRLKDLIKNFNHNS